VLAGHDFVQLRHDEIEVIGLAKEFGTSKIGGNSGLAAVTAGQEYGQVGLVGAAAETSRPAEVAIVNSRHEIRGPPGSLGRFLTPEPAGEPRVPFGTAHAVTVRLKGATAKALIFDA
jgi:hypothetical protein